jgi:hypothetical protein
MGFCAAGGEMKALTLGGLVALLLACFGCGARSTPANASNATQLSAAVEVNVISPQASSSVPSSFSISAQATSANAIAGWEIDVDGVNVYSGPAADSISTNLNAAVGTHQLAVKAWDTTGASGR